MLFRLILIFAGIFVAMNGYHEYGLLEKSTPEPIQVELLDLESGAELDNIHVQLGYHWKLWDELIYSYRQKENQADNDPSIKVDYAFYPLISDDHPHSKAYDELALQHSSLAEVPSEEIPTLKEFKVLVRTKQFKTIGELPDSGNWTDAVQLTGLVTKDALQLGQDERALLKQSYPKVRLSEILIIEEGRKPKSLASCLAGMVGGGGLILLGLYLIVHSTTGRKKDAGDAPPLIKAAEVMS